MELSRPNKETRFGLSKERRPMSLGRSLTCHTIRFTFNLRSEVNEVEGPQECHFLNILNVKQI